MDCGRPALGCAESFLDVTAAIFSSVSSTVAGPTLQLTPIRSAPQASSWRAKSSGLTPVGVSCRLPGPSFAQPRAENPRRGPPAGPDGLPRNPSWSRSRSGPRRLPPRLRSVHGRQARASSSEVAPNGSSRHTQRAHRSGNVEIFSGAFARQARPGQVDFADFGGQIELRQAQAVGPEGIGFKQFGAGFDIADMDFFDPLRSESGSARRKASLRDMPLA